MVEIRKRVDESWKEQVEQEKQVVGGPPASGQPAKEPETLSQQAEQPAAPRQPAAQQEPREEGLPEARFDLFISGIAIDALVALGDMPHPATKRQAVNLEHARYLVDLLGVIEEKTRGNLNADEERLLKDTLYQLRMRYLAKSG